MRKTILIFFFSCATFSATTYNMEIEMPKADEQTSRETAAQALVSLTVGKDEQPKMQALQKLQGIAIIANCNICSESFYDLNKHIEEAHGGIRNYFEFQAARTRDLIRYNLSIKASHPITPEFEQCEHCGNYFSKRGLGRHIKVSHSTKIEVGEKRKERDKQPRAQTPQKLPKTATITKVCTI